MPKPALKKKYSQNLPVEIWAQLYAAADGLFTLEPWEIIPPDILLKAAHPLTNEPVYASILGTMGNVFGISIQYGKWAEYSLMRALADDEEGALTENIHRHSSLKVEFVKKSELSAADKARLKTLAHTPQRSSKGACWPVVEVMKEGSVPCPPDADDAALILQLLPGFIRMVQAMAQHAQGDYDRLPEGIAAWPAGRHTESSLMWADIEWTPFQSIPEPACETFLLDEFTAVRLQELPRIGEHLELDAFAGFAAVNEGARPFFMKLGLAVNSKTRAVAGLELGTSGLDTLENIAGRLLVQVVTSLKARPKSIALRQKSLLDALHSTAETLGIGLRCEAQLPALAMVRSSMPEYFGV